MSADEKKGPGEKRRQPRVEFFSKVKVIDKESNSTQEVFAGNVSRGGMFLRSNRPLPKGREVALEFELDDGPVRVDVGEVVWTKPFEPVSVDGAVPGMGVQFKDLPAASRQRIEAFIDEVLQESGQANGQSPLHLAEQQESAAAQKDLPEDIVAMERETTPVPALESAPEPAAAPAGPPADSGEWTMSGPPESPTSRESTTARLKLDLAGGAGGNAMATFSTPPAPRQRLMLFTVFVLAVAGATFVLLLILKPFRDRKAAEPAEQHSSEGPQAPDASSSKAHAGQQASPGSGQVVPTKAKPDAGLAGPTGPGISPPPGKEKPATIVKPNSAPGPSQPSGSRPGSAPPPSKATARPAALAADSGEATASGASLTVGPPVFVSKPGGWRLVLKVSGPVTVKHFTLTNPPRLAIDVRGASYTGRTRTFSDPVEFVTRVRVGPHPDFVRFVLDFRGGRIPAFTVNAGPQVVEVVFPGQ